MKPLEPPSGAYSCVFGGRVTCMWERARRKMAREGGKGREAEKRKENPMSDEVWPGAPSVTGRAAVCEGAEVEQEEETHGDLGEVEEEGES